MGQCRRWARAAPGRTRGRRGGRGAAARPGRPAGRRRRRAGRGSPKRAPAWRRPGASQASSAAPERSAMPWRAPSAAQPATSGSCCARTASAWLRTSAPRAARRPRTTPARCPAARPAHPAPPRRGAASPAAAREMPSMLRASPCDCWPTKPGRVQRLAPRHLVLVDDLAADSRSIRMCSRARLRQAPPTACNFGSRKRRAGACAAIAARPRTASASNPPRGGQREGAERQGDAAPGPPPPSGISSRLRAAEVADHALRARRAGQHAERRVARLLLAGEHPQLQPGLRVDPAGRTPRRRRRRAPRRWRRRRCARLGGVEQGAEPAQGGQGGLDALGGQPAGARQVAAQPGQHLLVVDRPDRPPVQPVEHQAHGVGADVDHRDVGLVGLSGAREPTCSKARGRSLTFWPRPES